MELLTSPKMSKFSNGAVAEKRRRRNQMKKRLQRRAKEEKAQAERGVTLWQAGNAYTLIRPGVELDTSPHEAWAMGKLGEGNLFHFRSNDPNARRCAPVEALSKYVSVLRVKSHPPGQYIIPIHEHLEAMMPDVDPERLEEIMENGVPYCPDKRLRRLRQDPPRKKSHQRGAKPMSTAAKPRRKRRTVARGRTSREMLQMREIKPNHRHAPVPVDNKVACIVSGSTISTKTRNGVWDTNDVDLKTLPSLHRLGQLVKQTPDFFKLLGECVPLGDEEIIRRARAEEEAMQAENTAALLAGKSRGRRRKAVTADSLMSLGDDEAARMRDEEQVRRSWDISSRSSNEDDEDDDEKPKKRKLGEMDLFVPSEDDAWEGLPSEEEEEEEEEVDEDDLAFGRGEAFPESVAAQTTQSVKVKAAARRLDKEYKQRARKKAKPASAPAAPKMDQADEFLQKALKDPSTPGVPPEWVQIIEGNKDNQMVAVMLIQQTQMFQTLKAMAAVSK